MLEIVKFADARTLRPLALANKDLELVTRPLLWKGYTISNDTSDDVIEMIEHHLNNLHVRRKLEYVERVTINLKHDFLPHHMQRGEEPVNIDIAHAALEEISVMLSALPRLKALRVDLDGPELYRSAAASRLFQSLALPALISFRTNLSIDAIPRSFWEACQALRAVDFVSGGIARRARAFGDGDLAPPPLPLPSLRSLDLVDARSAFIARDSRLTRLRIWAFPHPEVNMQDFIENIASSLDTLEELGIHIPSYSSSTVPFYGALLPLLPNLRVLHLRNYPVGDARIPSQASAERDAVISAVGALPLLREVIWDTERMDMIDAFEVAVLHGRQDTAFGEREGDDSDGHDANRVPFRSLVRAEFKYWDSPITFGFARPRLCVISRGDARDSDWVKTDEAGFGGSRWPWYGSTPDF